MSNRCCIQPWWWFVHSFILKFKWFSIRLWFESFHLEIRLNCEYSTCEHFGTNRFGEEKFSNYLVWITSFRSFMEMKEIWWQIDWQFLFIFNSQYSVEVILFNKIHWKPFSLIELIYILVRVRILAQQSQTFLIIGYIVRRIRTHPFTVKMPNTSLSIQIILKTFLKCGLFLSLWIYVLCQFHSWITRKSGFLFAFIDEMNESVSVFMELSTGCSLNCSSKLGKVIIECKIITPTWWLYNLKVFMVSQFIKHRFCVELFTNDSSRFVADYKKRCL